MPLENISWVVWKLRCLPCPNPLPQVQYRMPQVKEREHGFLTHLPRSLLLPWAVYFAACFFKPYDRYKPSFMPPLSLLSAQGLGNIYPTERLWSLFSVLCFPHFVWYYWFTGWRRVLDSLDYSLDSAKGIWHSHLWLVLCQIQMEGKLLFDASLYMLCLIIALDEAPSLNDCHH